MDQAKRPAGLWPHHRGTGGIIRICICADRWVAPGKMCRTCGRLRLESVEYGPRSRDARASKWRDADPKRRQVERDVLILRNASRATRTLKERLATDPDFRARWIESSDRGRRAAGSAIQFRKSALQAKREREILRLLPKEGGMRIADLHGRFVQLCAEQGWPIVGAQRLKQIVDVMAGEHRVWSEVRSFGRAGRTTIVYGIADRPPAPPQDDFESKDAEEVSVQGT